MFTPNCYNSSKHDSTHPLNLSLRALVFVYHTFNTQGVRWSLSIGCSVSNSCIHSTMYEADSSSEVALTHFHLMNRYRAKQLLAKRLHSCSMCICTRRMTGRKLPRNWQRKARIPYHDDRQIEPLLWRVINARTHGVTVIQASARLP